MKFLTAFIIMFGALAILCVGLKFETYQSNIEIGVRQKQAIFVASEFIRSEYAATKNISIEQATCDYNIHPISHCSVIIKNLDKFEILHVECLNGTKCAIVK